MALDPSTTNPPASSRPPPDRGARRRTAPLRVRPLLPDVKCAVRGNAPPAGEVGGDHAVVFRCILPGALCAGHALPHRAPPGGRPESGILKYLGKYLGDGGTRRASRSEKVLRYRV